MDHETILCTVLYKPKSRTRGVLFKVALAACETHPTRTHGVALAARTHATGLEHPFTFTLVLPEAHESSLEVVFGNVGQEGAVAFVLASDSCFDDPPDATRGTAFAEAAPPCFGAFASPAELRTAMFHGSVA
eukprot:2180049-Pyramimonas_sp.AAC.1